MKFVVLASGSKGNCTLLHHKDTVLIIDCGSTKKYLTQCFESLQYDYREVNALLVTHTHSDHISQLKMFEHLPVYAAQELPVKQYKKISPYEKVYVDDFTITPLPMSHDCENTVGFVIEADGEKMVYITDTGYVRNEIKDYIQDADYYIMESNHDVEMLMQTSRPLYLKQRIMRDNGHLCNEDSANVLCEVIGSKTKEIVLAHISQEGNTRELAMQTLVQCLHQKEKFDEKIKLHAAAQFDIYIGGQK